MEPHYSCRWKDSITLTTKNDRKRKLHILPLVPPPLQRLEFTAVTSALRHQLLLGSLSSSCLFSIFSSLALGCFSISTERRQALSQLGTDGKITARESRVRGACVKHWGTHTPDRRNSTAGTIQHKRETESDREREKAGVKKAMWDEKKREVPHWILRRAAIPCFWRHGLVVPLQM